MKSFRTFQLAKQVFHATKAMHWPTAEMRDQSYRAALSIVLNIAEGYGKRTPADRRKFYHIALGSLREVQACLELVNDSDIAVIADRLGAHLFRLIQSPGQLS